MCASNTAGSAKKMFPQEQVCRKSGSVLWACGAAPTPHLLGSLLAAALALCADQLQQLTPLRAQGGEWAPAAGAGSALSCGNAGKSRREGCGRRHDGWGNPQGNQARGKHVLAG